ncbi:methyl-accepting chemotaxis protein [Thalassospira marina]|uniref:Methyl-accepting chemotaxis protein n=1 Tax=Thalassospira marina TaxID=2048283 RepID=A0A2N3KZB9_9PROT|nr:methyl-accepting chemotaxis protein [Thalassospira marina]PKR55806.1 methyl-accepting chemotaxis protein [Thalassospira marina]
MKLGNFGIATKVFAIIAVLGIAIIAVSINGYFGLSTMNQSSRLQETAANEALDGLRLTKLITSLNRAEFRIAADPTPDTIDDLNDTILRETQEFQTILAETAKTAGPKRLALLQDVQEHYQIYEQSIAKVLKTANDSEASEDRRALADQLTLQARANREQARGLNDSIRNYVAYAQQRLNGAVADADAAFTTGISITIIVAIVGLALGLGMGMLIARFGIVQPIRKIVWSLNELANNNLDVHVYGTDRRDEIGEISAAMEIFKTNMIRNREMEEAAERAEQQAIEDKKQAMNDLANQFDQTVGAIVTIVASTATELETAAQTLTSSLDETNAQSSTVSAAATEASTNVETVATACEELAASVRQIGEQVVHSSDVTQIAVEKGAETQRTAEGLVESVQKIGEVVNLIQDIAAQTNLLALNATIEAARAGEAGKGFAVVASEVKNLATQTARATENITSHISEVQAVTQTTVDAIRDISDVISRTRETASSISSAVDQQNSATQEIARNVSQASAGTQEVSSAISQVSEAANEGGAAAEQVLSSARELSTSAENLRREVDNFIAKVRAG